MRSVSVTRLLVSLDLEFLFDAGVQIADIRLALDDGFAIEFQQQPQHAVRRRMLRPHVEDHAAPRADLRRCRSPVRSTATPGTPDSLMAKPSTPSPDNPCAADGLPNRPAS